MLKHYLLSSFRVLWRNKSFTLLNVLGMSTGLAVVLLIFSLLAQYRSFEAYHPKADRLARVVVDYTNRDGEREFDADGSDPIAPYIAQNIASVEAVARTIGTGETQLGIYGPNNSLAQNDLFLVDQLGFADPAYFELFDISFLHGTIDSATFVEPNSIVLTASTAQRLFGSTTAAMGKVLNVQNLVDAQVVAIIEDYPANTNFAYDALMPYATKDEFGYGWLGDWGNSTAALTTWLLLQENFQQEDLRQMARHHLIDVWEGEEEVLDRYIYVAQPIREIHSDTRWGVQAGVQFDTTDELIFSGIGLIVLLLACINYINLSTARGFERLKEVGVRRVLGGHRQYIFYQLLSESVLLVATAFVFSLAIAALLNSMLIEGLSAISIRLLPSNIGPHLLFAAGLFVAVVIAAGVYPALVVSSFKPTQALKGKKVQAIGFGAWLRNGLVGFQFVVAQVLIITTLVFYAQRQYINSYDKGFTADAVLAVPLQIGLQEDAGELAERYRSIPGISAVSLSNQVPQTATKWGSDVYLLSQLTAEGEPFSENIRVLIIDENYLDQYGIELKAGRNLLPTDPRSNALVNEQLAIDAGVEPEELLNTQIVTWGDTFNVVGITAKHNDQSLRGAPRPIVYFKDASLCFTLSASIPMNDVPTTLERMQQEWYAVYPTTVFDYYFVEDSIARLYAQDTRMNKLLGIFATLAIIIAALGIYGLASYMIFQRRKELSIRKVLGAPLAHLLQLLLSRYAVTIVIAAVPAIGLAWYFGSNWLANFEFRMQLSWYYFASGAMVCLMVVPIIIGQQVWRAANVNPADVLRDE